MDTPIDKNNTNVNYHIYNKDCLEVLKNIPDDSIDLVVTDCPYKIVSGGCTNVPRKDEPSGIFNRRLAFTQQNAKSGKLFDFNDIQFKDWLPDKSIDMILCDLPYGTSACSFDKQIPTDKLWKEYTRIIKPTRAIVLFSQQPFTSLLINSNIKYWKYNWIWQKENGTNFPNAKYCPLKITEDICVFGDGAISYTPKGNNLIYNPQFTEGKPYTIISGKQKSDSAIVRKGSREDFSGYKTINNGKRYPKNIIKFNRDKDKLHPTQKPVALLEYLIKTYTNEGDLVLDNCMGSGSCGVACLNTNRNFLGMELDKDYFNIAKERINNALEEEIQL